MIGTCPFPPVKAPRLHFGNSEVDTAAHKHPARYAFLCATLFVNIMLFQFPEHWIALLGNRIKNVHLKEFTKKGTDHSLESFRPLLDGTTNWPAVLDAFDQTGYRGYLTFEYFHPYPHYPEALIYQTSDSLDRILGRKA